jgi:hypothetical protein
MSSRSSAPRTLCSARSTAEWLRRPGPHRFGLHVICKQLKTTNLRNETAARCFVDAGRDTLQRTDSSWCRARSSGRRNSACSRRPSPLYHSISQRDTDSDRLESRMPHDHGPCGRQDHKARLQQCPGHSDVGHRRGVCELIVGIFGTQCVSMFSRVILRFHPGGSCSNTSRTQLHAPVSDGPDCITTLCSSHTARTHTSSSIAIEKWR